MRDEPDYRARYDARVNSRLRAWRATPEGKAASTRANRKWRELNPEEARLAMRVSKKIYYDRLRAAMIEGYGSTCVCCGIDEPVFLALDHVNDDGNVERKAMSKTGKNKGVEAAMFYRMVIGEGFPDRYQLLCHNCNHAKRKGACPHKTVRV